KSGVLSTLFAVALLASGQNSTITGTLTGQVVMEGFIHMKMPLWARRLVTRLISVIPVLISVLSTSGQSEVQQHVAINNLMNNSQVFLAFALPFSMLPLLMLTNSKTEMGQRFKNSLWVNVLGWASVIGLTYLNMICLPGSFEAFFGTNPTAAQIVLSDRIAYVIIALIIALLIWTVYDLYRGDKQLAQKELLAKQQTQGGQAND